MTSAAEPYLRSTPQCCLASDTRHFTSTTDFSFDYPDFADELTPCLSWYSSDVLAPQRVRGRLRRLRERCLEAADLIYPE